VHEHAVKRVPVALALLLGVAQAHETTLDGRVSLRGLYSTDTADNPRVGFTFLETDASAGNLTSGGLRLVLDATFLLDITDAEERRFGKTETFDQVRELYAEQPLDTIVARVGRRLIAPAGQAWVDGVDLELHVDEGRSSLGAYGGLSPDRYDYSLTTKYQAAGAYGTVHRDGFDGALAFNTLFHEGALDRDWLFNRLHYRLAPGLFVASYVVVDFVKTPAVTTLLATVDYTPVPPLNLTLNFSRYAIEQYRDASIYHDVIEPNQALLIGDEVVDLVYNRIRFAASLRFWGRFYQYQSIEYKARAQDDREAWFYTIGLRDEDWFGLGTRVDLSASYHNNFVSDAYLYALTLDQDIGGSFSLEGRATWYNGRTIGRTTDRGRLFDEAQKIILVGGAFFWRPWKAHQFDVDYDGVYEAELQDVRNEDNLFIHTWMGRYTYLF
jgi:hypothetical protein